MNDFGPTTDACDKCRRCGITPEMRGNEIYCPNCGDGVDAPKWWEAVQLWNQKQRGNK